MAKLAVHSTIEASDDGLTFRFKANASIWDDGSLNTQRLEVTGKYRQTRAQAEIDARDCLTAMHDRFGGQAPTYTRVPRTLDA